MLSCLIREARGTCHSHRFRSIWRYPIVQSVFNKNKKGPENLNFLRLRVLTGIDEERSRNLFFVNDGPGMLALEGLGDIPFFHTIDDLNLINNLAILKNLKTWALNN